MPGLATQCVNKLATSITTDNAADLLVLADARHFDQLQSVVFDFLRADKTRLAAMMKAEAFNRLSPAMLKELLTLSAAQWQVDQLVDDHE